eukprot:scaffold77816_cov63-Phaeocystis_antarctica.AAC.1
MVEAKLALDDSSVRPLLRRATAVVADVPGLDIARTLAAALTAALTAALPTAAVASAVAVAPAAVASARVRQSHAENQGMADAQLQLHRQCVQHVCSPGDCPVED